MRKTMLAALALALALAWSAAALAYPVDMEFENNGLDVLAEVDRIGEQTIVRLANGESFTVRCEAVFRNGPEQSRARRVVLGPGEARPVVFTPQRTVVRMRVSVRCESEVVVAPGD